MTGTTDMKHTGDESRDTIADLERRIEELSRAPESEYGLFTRLDWTICLAAFVALPYLLYLWFWP